MRNSKIDYHLSHLRDLFGDKGNHSGLVQLHTNGLLLLHENGELFVAEEYQKVFKKITDKLLKSVFAWSPKKNVKFIGYQILYFALKAIIDENNPYC
jgi:hypothetical protein